MDTDAPIEERMAETAQIAQAMVAHGLTERQQQVAWQYIAGVPTADIAERLHLSPKTVQYHVTGIYHAFGIRGSSHHARIQLRRLLLGLPANAQKGSQHDG